MTLLDWTLLAVGLVALTTGNWLFYFGRRKLSYPFLFGALGLFALGFALAAFQREDYTAAYSLMLIFLIVYVAERVGFLLVSRLLASRRKEGRAAQGEERQDEDSQRHPEG